MWLSGQQKRPADESEGQTGIVTMSGGETAVLLDRERRGLQLYSPGGYTWTPEVGQRVLVIQGRGEIPCVVGALQGSIPDQVGIRAKELTLAGETVRVSAQEGAAVSGERIDLNGQVYVKGETLEDLIRRIVASMLGG
ncbi:MAG: hypothetical protein K2O11_04940 [Oscillospiraceae bacterium]|nr:hypothetical protein [Oscillospiraceae bacterium]